MAFSVPSHQVPSSSTRSTRSEPASDVPDQAEQKHASCTWRCVALRCVGVGVCVRASERKCVRVRVSTVLAYVQKVFSLVHFC